AANDFVESNSLEDVAKQLDFLKAPHRQPQEDGCGKTVKVAVIRPGCECRQQAQEVQCSLSQQGLPEPVQPELAQYEVITQHEPGLPVVVWRCETVCRCFLNAPGQRRLSGSGTTDQFQLHGGRRMVVTFRLSPYRQRDTPHWLCSALLAAGAEVLEVQRFLYGEDDPQLAAVEDLVREREDQGSDHDHKKND